MSTKMYNPKDAWPTAVLAQFLETRERRGYHLIYKNGLLRGDYEPNMNQMGRLMNGWTARVFLFRTRLSARSEVQIIKGGYFAKAKLPVDDANVKVELSGYDPKVDNKVLGPTVKEGEICSLGIRWREPKYLTALCNDKESSWMNVVTGIDAFKFKIWQGGNIALSIHLTGELDKLYIPIRSYFDIPEQRQPPGSSIVAFAKVFNPAQNVRVGFDVTEAGAKGVAWLDYGKPSLKSNMEFYVYARHLPGYYAVQTSFDPKQRRVDTQKKSEDNIWLYISDNSEILRITQHIVGYNEPQY